MDAWVKDVKVEDSGVTDINKGKHGLYLVFHIIASYLLLSKLRAVPQIEQPFSF